MKKYQATVAVLKTMFQMAHQKLEVARSDLDRGFTGDAASRAYYAAFHAISTVLAQKGLAFKSHGQLLSAFNLHFVKTKVFPPDTFRKLQRLFEDRQVGDYEASLALDMETARKDVADAEWLVDQCREWLENEVGHSFRE